MEYPFACYSIKILITQLSEKLMGKYPIDQNPYL